MNLRSRPLIPLFAKIFYFVFMAILIPVYWLNYGPANFLWISDVTLILAFLATLFENKLLASMAAVGGLVLESFWTLSFILVIVFDVRLTGMVDYMFDPSLPLGLRALSLFHVVLPFLVVWQVKRLGYAKQAVWIQIPLLAVLLTTCLLVTNPASNINWVFNYQKFNMDPAVYLALEWAVISLIILCTHLFLVRITRKSVIAFEASK